MSVIKNVFGKQVYDERRQAIASRQRYYDIPKVVIDFESNGRNLPTVLTSLGATFNRLSSRYIWKSDDTIELIGNNVAPMTWNVFASQYNYKPDLTLTGRWTRSNDPAQAVWVKNGYTVSATTETSPEPAFTSKLIKETATNAVHEISRTQAATINQQQMFHYVIKPVGIDYIAINFKSTNGVFVNSVVVFSLSGNGTVFSNSNNMVAGIVKRGQYYEIYAAQAALATATATVSLVGCSSTGIPSTSTTYTGDVNKGFYWFNAQSIISLNLPSVIITTTTQVTTQSDVLSFPVSNLEGFNNTGFSVFVYFYKMPQMWNNKHLFTITSAATANYITMRYDVTGYMGALHANQGKTPQTFDDILLEDGFHKFGTSFTSDETISWFDTERSDYLISDTGMPAHTIAYIGNSSLQIGQYRGFISKIVIYPTVALKYYELENVINDRPLL